jgi:hypothetical protein
MFPSKTHRYVYVDGVSKFIEEISGLSIPHQTLKEGLISAYTKQLVFEVQPLRSLNLRSFDLYLSGN